jgi:hypothetical protein
MEFCATYPSGRNQYGIWRISPRWGFGLRDGIFRRALPDANDNKAFSLYPSPLGHTKHKIYNAFALPKSYFDWKIKSFFLILHF